LISRSQVIGYNVYDVNKKNEKGLVQMEGWGDIN
jgi:hypothetical protein